MVAVSDVVRIVGGGTPTRSNLDYYGGIIPWVTPKDMKSWDICDSQVRLTQEGVDCSATRIIPAGSVLVVVRSGVLKHTLPVGINRRPVTINQDLKALICDDIVIPDYLAHYLKAKSGEILGWVRATTADNFPIDNLKKLQVPLPPLEDQRHIVEVLDRADAMLAKRRRSIALLEGLPKSVFLDIFGDPGANPKNWP